MTNNFYAIERVLYSHLAHHFNNIVQMKRTPHLNVSKNTLNK